LWGVKLLYPIYKFQQDVKPISSTEVEELNKENVDTETFTLLEANSNDPFEKYRQIQSPKAKHLSLPNE
jgi:hypothetical protein